MRLNLTRSAVLPALAAIFCLCLGAADALAQGSSFERKPAQPKPAAPGQIRPQVAPEPAPQPAPAPQPQSGWNTEVEQNFDGEAQDSGAQNEASEPEAPAEQPAQTAAVPAGNQADAIERVNAYFNSITHLQGTFIQVDGNNERTRGRFYVQRPGRIRFDYITPSTLRIVADGRNLSIEDIDLKTVDTYPLEKTPFRMLLAKNVDLVRDARVVDVKQGGGTVALTLSDRARESGDITLVFDIAGSSLTLKEWVIDDAQGLKTRITVGNLTEGKALSSDFFQPTPMTFPTLPN